MAVLTAELAPLARLGNRYGFFSCMAINDRDRASDIRMYNQQDICESYASSDMPFSANGPFAKLAWGRGGALTIVSASVSVLFTAAAYLFVCLKALAGAFGAGSVVQSKKLQVPLKYFGLAEDGSLLEAVYCLLKDMSEQ